MKQFKKLISLLLVMATLISLPALSSAVAQATDENLPVVFIGGRGTTLIDKDKNVIYPRSFDAATAVKNVVPALAEANITLDYDEFCDVLYDSVADMFKDLPLDNNGNALNGTNTDFTWTKTSLSWSVRHDEPYRIYDYCFYYDWRLDPCEIADTFASYVDDVLEVTGAEKVKIIARCMGGNIVMAYLSEYGCQKVERCLFYVSTVNGVASCGAPFAGDFNINRDAAERFAADLGMDPIYTLGSNSALNELVGAAVKVLSETGGIDLAVAAVENVYYRVEENVVPRLLLATFATYPSYWSMIGSDYFEAAKKSVFAGREEEYAGLIKKIDNYHYNIQLKISETLKRLESEGLDISVVCKYGAQQVPVSDEYNMLSDDTVELYRSSFGATCCELDESFDDSYIKNADYHGTAKYISPDKQVDCSTCLFPDYTWVIKDCTHTDFPACIDSFMMTIINYPGRMTINDNKSYPQFLLYDRDEKILSPLVNDNCDTTERWETSFFEALLTSIKIVFTMIFKSITAKK